MLSVKLCMLFCVLLFAISHAELNDIDNRNGTKIIHFVPPKIKEYKDINSDAIEIIYIILMVISLHLFLYCIFVKLCNIVNIMLESIYMVRSEPVNTDTSNSSQQQRIGKPLLNRLFFFIIGKIVNFLLIILLVTNVYNAVALREHLLKTTLFQVVYNKFILSVNYQWIAIWLKALKMPLKVVLDSLDSFYLYLSLIDYYQLSEDLMSFILEVSDWFKQIIDEVQCHLGGNVEVN